MKVNSSTPVSSSFRKLLSLAILLLLTTFIGSDLSAANRTWTNASGTNNWSDPGNWTAMPGPSDVAVFNGTSLADCNINQNVSISGININSAYSGTITQTSGYTITLGTGSFAQGGGIFNGGNSIISTTGSFTMTGGTFNAPTAELQIALNMTIGATSTFNPGTGTVNFTTGTTARTINVNVSQLFYNARFTGTRGATIPAADTLIVTNQLELTANQIKTGFVKPGPACTVIIDPVFNGGTGTLYIAYPLTINYPNNVGGAMGLWVNDAGATVNIGTGTTTFWGAINIAAGTFNGGSGNHNYETSLTIGSAGMFNATSGIANLKINFTKTAVGGTFTHNNGTFIFTSSNNATYNVAAKETFYNVTIDKTGAAKVLTISSGDTLVADGLLNLIDGDLNTGTLQPNGTFSMGSTFNGGTGKIYVDHAVTLALNSTDTICAITLNHPGAVVNCAGSTSRIEGVFNLMDGTFNGLNSKLNFASTITQSGGTFNSTSDTLFYSAGTWVKTAGTFNHNNGTVYFNKSDNIITVTLAGAANFYNVSINLTNASASKDRFTVSAGDTLSVSNLLVLADGQLYSGIVKARAAVNAGAAFDGGAGQLWIEGGSGPRTITFSSAKSSGLVLNDPQATVNATAGMDFTVGGILTISDGTFTPATYPLTITGVYTQTGGTFSTPSAKVTFSSTFNQSGGTFNASSDSTEFKNTFNSTAGVFNHHNGTVAFVRTDNSITANVNARLELYNLFLNFTNGTYYTLAITSGDTLVVAHALTIKAGNIGTGVVELQGTMNNISSVSGGNGKILIANGTGPRTINLDAIPVPGLLLSDPNVTINAPAGTLTVSGAFTILDGVFNAGAGTLQINGAYAQSGGTMNASGPINVTSTFTLSAGTFTAGSGAIAINSNFTQSAGTFTAGAAPISIAGSFSQSGASTFTGGSGDISTNSTFTVSGAGTSFTAPAGVLSVRSTFSIVTPATFAHNNGTLKFVNTGTTTLAHTGTLTLNNLELDAAGTNIQLRPNCNLILLGNLTIGPNSVLSQSTSSIDITLAGNYTDNNASDGLLEGTRTVTFNGNSTQTLTAAATETFYRLVNSNTSGAVALAGNVTVSNLLTLTPATGAKFLLGSSDLTIGNSASISGGTSNEFIVTNGAGSLVQNNLGATGRNGSILFPVGRNTSSYTPMTIQNAGTNDNFDLTLNSHVFEYGTVGYGREITEGELDLTWHLEEASAGGSNVSMTIQWNASDELTGFDRNSTSVLHFTNGGWIQTQPEGPASGSGPYTRTTTGITTFSPFGGGGGGALPVELLEFNATKDNGKVNVTWSTAIEVNNDKFTVERSKDAVNYEMLVEVTGAGNSTTEQRYSVRDMQPLKGVSYYRLKQTDFDGKFKYYSPVSVATEEAAMVADVYPNPAEKGEINISLAECQSGSAVNIRIADVAGKMVQNTSATCAEGRMSEPLVLDKSLSTGMYFLEASSGASVWKQKVMIR